MKKYIADDVEEDGQTLYEIAYQYDIKGAFQLTQLEPEQQLELIKKAIKVRVKITKQEIFKIGELLHIAKQTCQQTGAKFKQWIENNFDFSYETANNFMNVYQNCIGYRQIALEIPSSILYQISSPGFPEDLKTYLLENANLSKITNGKFQKILQKFREGGIKSITEDLDTLTTNSFIIRQTKYSLNIAEEALRTIQNLWKKGHDRLNQIDDETDLQNNLPECYNLIEDLNSAIEQSRIDLDEAIKKAKEKIKELELTLVE